MPIMSSKLESELANWQERASISRQYANEALASACDYLVKQYELLLNSESESSESELMLKAQRFRKMIEASEQHRTMCVEHGLDDSAIDATYEIQEIEGKLIALVSAERRN